MKKQYIIPQIKSFVIEPVVMDGLSNVEVTNKNTSEPVVRDNNFEVTPGGGDGSDMGARGGSMWSGGDWDEEF